jgi:carboxyl-terminal processing protease
LGLVLGAQDVWKRVDKLYLDRTFNGQDWFALRQKALRRNFKTTQEVYDAIKVPPAARRLSP